MDRSKAKQRMMATLRREISDERVLAVMEAVRREAFVPPELASQAYDNKPLPIGEGQTISQPLMVGIMLQALSVQPDDVVLDVGTGSGYQAALLGRLAARVVTVERIPVLADRARRVLRSERCWNVEVRTHRSASGLPDEAFDGIVVGAAAPAAPASLVDRLAIGGRLVIPVGTPVEQRLARVVRTEDGTSVQWLGPCRFVPLIGEEGWSEDFSA